MVDFEALFGFQINPLALELITQLALGVPGGDDGLLVFGHLVFAELFEPAILLEQPLNLFLQLLVVEDPLIFLPSFALHISIKFSLLVPPLLLFLSKLFLYFFSEVPLSFPLSFPLLSLILPFYLEFPERLEVLLFEESNILMQLSDLVIFELIRGG